MKLLLDELSTNEQVTFLDGIEKKLEWASWLEETLMTYGVEF